MVNWNEFLSCWEKYKDRDWMITGSVGRHALFLDRGVSVDERPSFRDVDVCTLEEDGKEEEIWDSEFRILFDVYKPRGFFKTIMTTVEDVRDSHLEEVQVGNGMTMQLANPEFQAVYLLCSRTMVEDFPRYGVAFAQLLPLGLDTDRMVHTFGTVIELHDMAPQIITEVYARVMERYAGNQAVIASCKEGAVFNLLGSLEIQLWNSTLDLVSQRTDFEDIAFFTLGLRNSVYHTLSGDRKRVLGFMQDQYGNSSGEDVFRVGGGIGKALEYAHDKSQVLTDMLAYCERASPEAVSYFGNAIQDALKNANPDIKAQLYGEVSARQDRTTPYDLRVKCGRILFGIMGIPSDEQMQIALEKLDDPTVNVQDIRVFDFDGGL